MEQIDTRMALHKPPGTRGAERFAAIAVRNLPDVSLALKDHFATNVRLEFFPPDVDGQPDYTAGLVLFEGLTMRPNDLRVAFATFYIDHVQARYAYCAFKTTGLSDGASELEGSGKSGITVA